MCIKKLIPFILFSLYPVIIFAQNSDKPLILHSNQKSIKLFINKGENDWIITPEKDPDILRLFSTTVKEYDMKFISDMDSLVFTVKVNQPVFMNIIYAGDTTKALIDFIDYIPNSLTDKEKIKTLALFWSEIKYNFAFIDKLNFNPDSLFAEYISKVLETKNDYEFYKLLDLFAGRMKDAHTQINFNDISEYTDFIPVQARYFNNELRVVNVRNDLADRIPPGTRILKVNGRPLEEYMGKYIHPYIESGYEPTVRRLAASRLFSFGLDTISVEYETPGGVQGSVILPRDGKEKNIQYTGYTARQPTVPIELKYIDNIAILSFNTFNDYNGRLVEQFEKLKDTLYKARGIILDLRQNGGGSTAVAQHLLQYIIRDSCYLTYAWQTRINDGVKRATGNFIKNNADFYKTRAYRTIPADTIRISDTIQPFNAPVVILISNNTASAAEDLLIMLYERQERPLLIGDYTFGSTGSPLVISGFPEGWSARVCTRRVLFPYSLKPFTKGIKPDIIIKYSYDEFMSGKDKEIETALEILKKNSLTKTQRL